MSTRHFRAGVGTVIYNEEGKVAIFKRAQSPIGVWELQQGGIDLNESVHDTLWRELKEEVGLEPGDVERVTEMPSWTIYHSPTSLSDNSIPVLGQGHYWFFLKLKAGRDIDLTTALEVASLEFCWTTFDYLISLTGDHKKHVYETLKTFFFTTVIK